MLLVVVLVGVVVVVFGGWSMRLWVGGRLGDRVVDRSIVRTIGMSSFARTSMYKVSICLRCFTRHISVIVLHNYIHA